MDMQSTILLILQLVLYPALCMVNICPSLEDLHPCYCVSDGRTIRVDCLGTHSVSEVKSALQSVKGIRRVFIDFLKARFEKVPSDFFKGLHVTKLSFTNCNLKEIGDEERSALEGLEDIIEEFSIHFSFMDENDLKFLNVSGLRVIEDLEIEGNDIHEMGDEWFREGPVSLKNLFIMSNLIEKMGDNAFASLNNLKILWLTGNHFKIFKRSMLPDPALYLTSLDLTNNEIASLTEDMFSNMPSLKEVVLAENEIQHLAENTWGQIWSKLSRLYLESNPLQCDQQIDWMFRMPRPYVVKGKCVLPVEKSDLDLKKIIDDKRWEDDLRDIDN